MTPSRTRRVNRGSPADASSRMLLAWSPIRPGERHEGQIPDRRAWRSEVPVDETRQPIPRAVAAMHALTRVSRERPPYGVVRGGVVVSDDVPGPPGPEGRSPPGPAGRNEVRHRVVVAAQPMADLCKRLVGVHPGRPRPGNADRLPRQVAEHLAVLIVQAEHPGRTGGPAGFQMTQQGMHRRRPRPGGTPHCPAGEYRTTGVTPGQPLLFHRHQPGMIATRTRIPAGTARNNGAPPARSFPAPGHRTIQPARRGHPGGPVTRPRRR